MSSSNPQVGDRVRDTAIGCIMTITKIDNGIVTLTETSEKLSDGITVNMPVLKYVKYLARGYFNTIPSDVSIAEHVREIQRMYRTGNSIRKYIQEMDTETISRIMYYLCNGIDYLERTRDEVNGTIYELLARKERHHG